MMKGVGMNYGLSDQVRVLVEERYVKPAAAAGVSRFSVAARDLMRDLKSKGFPARNWPQICSSIQSAKFLRANGLEIESIDGPPSKQSSTVVVHYRVAGSERVAGKPVEASDRKVSSATESPEERAHRLTGKLFGLLKEELAEFGGGEAFMRWIRSDDAEAK